MRISPGRAETHRIRHKPACQPLVWLAGLVLKAVQTFLANAIEDDGNDEQHTQHDMDKASIYYETARALHAEFHNTVARVVTRAFDGRKEEAKEMIDLYGEFTSISAKLARTISAWRDASQ